jgi:hypothetical protein
MNAPKTRLQTYTTLLSNLDDVAIAGVVDKDGNAFYDALHSAIEIVENLIEQEKCTSPSTDELGSSAP